MQEELCACRLNTPRQEFVDSEGYVARSTLALRASSQPFTPSSESKAPQQQVGLRTPATAQDTGLGTTPVHRVVHPLQARGRPPPRILQYPSMAAAPSMPHPGQSECSTSNTRDRTVTPETLNCWGKQWNSQQEGGCLSSRSGLAGWLSPSIFQASGLPLAAVPLESAFFVGRCYVMLSCQDCVKRNGKPNGHCQNLKNVRGELNSKGEVSCGRRARQA